MIKINNFHIGSSYCRELQDGGGVCILIDNSIEYKERTDISALSVESNFEICAIDLLNVNKLLINVYWPNSTKGIETFFTCLEKLLKMITNKDKNKCITIGGDFNVDFLKESKLKRQLQNLMLTYDFHQLVKEPTRVTKNSSTCLDLIFVNYYNTDLKVNVQEFGFSDHKGVECNLPLAMRLPQYFTLYKRTFKEGTINKFKEELNTINWDSIILKNKNVNENYDNFIQTLQQALNKCMPLKLIKIYQKKSYLTPGLKLSCRNKRLLRVLITKTKNQILHDYYINYTRILKKAFQMSKKVSNIQKFRKSSNSIKTMWQIIKDEKNKKRTHQKQNTKLKVNNVLLENPKEIANVFNNYFSSISNLQISTGQHIVTQTKKIENSIFLGPVYPREVYTIIKNLKNKNSSGIDEIPPKLIKKCANELTTPYTILLNQSFDEGVFPNALKISVVKPIYKSGEKTDPSNYRPISLLPTSAKIFETAMAKRIYAFFEKYEILNDSQYGFRKKRSTTLAVYKFMQNILNTINIKQYSVGLLLDMSKAYDRVRYDILLQKLFESGIRGKSLNWFKSYLENRTQFTEIEYTNFETGLIQSTRSDRVPIKGSIPQGSVLGCFLFLIYINSITSTLNENSCILYADDITVMIPCSDTNELENKLNTVLDNIINYLDCHNLTLNFKKTKLIQFKPYQKKSLQFNYKYKNTPLEQVNSATLLGIEIDTHLNWKQHLQKLAKKLSSFIYALINLKKVTNFETALSAYYAYAHSRLTYGIILWGNCTDIQDIFVLQKKCVRILTNIDQMESCRPYFKKHCILTLTCIYIYESCKFVKNHSNLYSPIKNTSLKRNNRGANSLKIPFSKLKLITSGPHAMMIKIYNHLPNKIREAETIPSFLKLLRNFLVNKCYYDIKEYLDDKTV